jgi:hypothetical protein
VVGRQIGGTSRRLGVGRRWSRTVEEKAQAGSGREVPLARVPQTEVADLVQAFGQDVLQEAADECQPASERGSCAGLMVPMAAGGADAHIG